MKIMDFLVEDAIKIGLTAKAKIEVIEELVDILVAAKKISDKEKVIKCLIEREELGSTGIGQAVAIPHAKSNAVKELVSAFGLSHDGVNFDALDGEPVRIFFLLLAPDSAAGTHLKALAKISGLLKNKHFRKMLLNAGSKEDVIKIIKEEEKVK